MRRLRLAGDARPVGPANELLALEPELSIEPLRGNIDTRLRKRGERGLDAVVLAACGLAGVGALVASRGRLLCAVVDAADGFDRLLAAMERLLEQGHRFAALTVEQLTAEAGKGYRRALRDAYRGRKAETALRAFLGHEGR